MLLMEAFFINASFHPFNERFSFFHHVQVKRYMCFQVEIQSRKKMYMCYIFLSKFHEIHFGKGVCGDPSKDISAPRAIAYFKDVLKS